MCLGLSTEPSVPLTSWFCHGHRKTLLTVILLYNLSCFLEKKIYSL